ncbi:MAG: aldo/keto reductase [Propionicimonas sp.]
MLHVFGSSVEVAEELDLGRINHALLGMGLLPGKFGADSTFPADDVRRTAAWRPGFLDGRPTRDWLDKIDAIRDVLTSDGRTLAQGALALIWARSDRTVPIPGFKSVRQVEDNCGALDRGPLTSEQMSTIEDLAANHRRRYPLT